MNVILLTIFLSILLSLGFITAFAVHFWRRGASGWEQDALMPLSEGNKADKHESEIH